MPVTESQFSRSQLWPKSNHNWMAPGAVASTAAVYGPGYDLGALRVRNGIWEILITKTPTQADPSNSEWTAFEPSQPQWLMAANAFNRYGPGWSYGPGHNLHDEHRGYLQEYNAAHGLPAPTEMEMLDVAHDRALFSFYSKWAMGAETGPVEPVKPEPEKPKPDPVIPAPVEPTPGPVEPPSVTIERLTAQLLKTQADRDSFKGHLEAAVKERFDAAEEVARLQGEIERLLRVVPEAPPLSAPEQRAEELWSLALPCVKLAFTTVGVHFPGQVAKQLWGHGKPLAVELIKAWRRRR